MPDPLAWRDRAACVGKPIEWFFPERAHGDTQYKNGKECCAGCPVTNECLELAEMNLATGDRFGLYGGKTPNERRTMRRIKLNYVLWEGASFDDF
jgi:WhiB family redox-sensing transcriptional regulator